MKNGNNINNNNINDTNNNNNNNCRQQVDCSPALDSTHIFFQGSEYSLSNQSRGKLLKRFTFTGKISLQWRQVVTAVLLGGKSGERALLQVSNLVLAALSCHLDALAIQQDTSHFRSLKVQVQARAPSQFERHKPFFRFAHEGGINLTRRFPTGAKMNVQQKCKCQLGEKFQVQTIRLWMP